MKTHTLTMTEEQMKLITWALLTARVEGKLSTAGADEAVVLAEILINVGCDGVTTGIHNVGWEYYFDEGGITQLT